VILLMIAGWVAVFLYLTSRRSQVTRGTLALGGSSGLLFGVVMYLVAPLGLGNNATDPWLPGSRVDPLAEADRAPVLALSSCIVFRLPHARSPGPGLPMTYGE